MKLSQRFTLTLSETERLVNEIMEMSEDLPDAEAFRRYLLGLKIESLRERHTIMSGQSLVMDRRPMAVA